MKILILGGAGMVGQKLLNKILDKQELRNKKVSEITLFDIIKAPYPDNTTIPIITKSGDISDPSVSADIVSSKPDVIFHLAAIVSGQAEQEFDLGWNINAKGSWGLFEAIRSQGDDYCPRVVFTSSIAVFGAPFPDKIPDDFFTTPLTSYGAQKAISELLLADYSRKGMIDGISIRLPTICVRPGKPNLAASGFFSGIIREPLNGQEAILPVDTDVRHWHATPRSAAGFLIHAAEIDTKKLNNRITLNMPGLSATVQEQIDALGRVAGNDVIKLIKHQPDPVIQKIVSGWARDFDTQRSIDLGFKAETNFDEIIKIYIEDDLKK
jgi:nucleoside-diphosphate-sugar epimerase|tara:strand:+ start:104 stop:1075 length:972 start_codon:yes stop_codon:yes gene_type:complete